MATLEQWRKQLQNTRGIFQKFPIFLFPSGRFKPSAKLTIRQILPVGVILVDFLGCK